MDNRGTDSFLFGLGVIRSADPEVNNRVLEGDHTHVREIKLVAGMSESIEAHYTVTNIAQAILDALKIMGKELDAITPADLASVDEFHIGGREATTELAQLAGLNSEIHVLDLGSGLGGSARYMASEFGSSVTGLDLTQEYCDVATMLAGLTHLDSKVVFRQGSALDMPFESESFDLVWTEHTQMNISDKMKFYSEIARVLRPDGRLVFHDIFQGEGGDVHYPVPWAADSSISFLIPVDQLEKLLHTTAFRPIHWEDTTHWSLDWFRQPTKEARLHRSSPLGLHLVMGVDTRAKFQNMVRNLEEGRVAVVQAVLEKVR